MLLRSLPALALFAGFSVLLVNCSSDSPSPGGGAGAPSAGSASTVAGAPSAGAPAGGSPSAAGGGSTSVGGGGSSSLGGGSSSGAPSVAGTSGGSSVGGASTGGGSSAGAAGKAGGGSGGAPTSGSFTLTSPDHVEAAKFDGKFTCNGGALMTGIIPELNWAGAPSSTMSYAITFIDTTIGDTNAMGQHWAIWNIPATVSKIPQGTKALSGDLAGAKQSGNFFAPCAQSLKNGMDDVYEFTIYALPTATLNITGSSVANALTALKAISPKPPTATLHGHSGLKGQ